jgi:hypothetical protein
MAANDMRLPSPVVDFAGLDPGSSGAMLLPILVGALLGGLFTLVAHRRGDAGERRLLSVALVVAALIYLGFALAAASGRWLAYEAAGLALFAGVAWLGLRVGPWWLVLGWILHVGWDVGLHLDRSQPIVGAWYPLLCVGFDLVVAGFLLRAAAGQRPQRASLHGRSSRL